MRSVMLFCILSFSASIYAITWQDQDRIFLERVKSLTLPQDFGQTISFSLPKVNSEIHSIVYGNSAIGYFSTKNFRRKRNRLELTFIPPSYLKELEFQAVLGQTRQSLGKRHFVNPLGSPIEGRVNVTSQLSFPFVMMNWVFNDRILPVVVNRLGEIVWIYSHQERKANPRWFDDAIQILDDGQFLFVNKYDFSVLLVVDSFGKIERQIDFASEHLPGNSHNVQYLPDTHELIYLSFDCRKLAWWNEFVPIFQGPAGWLRLMTLPRRTYRGSKLLRLSLDTLKIREIWSSFDSFSPNQFPSLAVGSMAPPDRSMDARTSEEYLQSSGADGDYLWSDWPDKLCDVDWTHENSVHYIASTGYLVSARNLNKVFLIDENGKLKWSMGEGPNNDYQFKRDGSSFSMQHSARMLPEGRVLVYDNHSPYRMQSGLRLGNRLVVLKPNKPGIIQPGWSFNLPTVHSDVRGATQPLANHHIFSYSAGNPGDPVNIFEVDPRSSAILGQLRIDLYSGMKGFEAKPFYGFGGDKFLPEAMADAKTFESKTDLDFCY